jgi:cation-transporting ATPase E
MESVTRCDPPLETGLTPAQAQARLRSGLDNRERIKSGKSVASILRENLLTLFNLLNLVLALAVLMVGSPRNALFMGVVFSNAIIGTLQALRAKRAVEKLRLIASVEARVLRGGCAQSIPIEQIVLDDLMLFETGNQIPADAIVRGGDAQIDESLLTGESRAVRKGPGDRLLSGSFVTSGRCIAQAERVGDNTYAATLAREAKKHKQPRSELMRALNGLIRGLSFLIVPLGLLLFCRQYFYDSMPLEQSVVSTVAAMVGMIPEGLMLLTSVALAVGVVRLSRRRTLVQSLYSMEDLARVDVLCLDKTGTITSGELRFERMEAPPGGQLQAARLLGALLAATKDTNATARALRAHFPPDAGLAASRAVPFSSARKWSAAQIDGASVVLGAPQFVLPEGDALLSEVARFTSDGFRVLALSRAGCPLPEEGLPDGLAPLALVVLSDEIRPEAPETIAFFEREDVDVRVISGDDPQTASAAAVRAGIKNADRFVDASTLKGERALHEAAARYAVFGRVSPDQKRDLVRAFKAQGHVVAMTGDGVNDIPALKEADCSIAMASGSDAARKVASLVLLDCNFATMPEIVMEGRRVIGNIRRSASLFLTKTIFSFILSLLSLITGAGYPFVPIQLTLFSTTLIGIPSFLLALEPSRSRIKGRFMHSVLSRALPGGLTIAVGAGALSALSDARGYSSDLSGTLATVYLLVLGLAVLYAACRPFNWKRAAVFALSVLMIAVALIGFAPFFQMVPLTPGPLRLLAAAVLIAVPAFFALNSLFHRFFSAF